MKRKLSFLIAAIMVLSLLPAMSVSASSANSMLLEGGTVSDDYCWSAQMAAGGNLPILKITKNDNKSNWSGAIFSLYFTNCELHLTTDATDTSRYLSTMFGTGLSTSWALPTSYTVTRTTTGSDNPLLTNGGDRYFSNATAVVTRVSPNEAQVYISDDSTGTDGSLLIPLLVKMTGEGEARVEIRNAGNFGINTGSYRVAIGASGATTTTIADSSKTFSSSLIVPDIKITENRVNSLETNGGTTVVGADFSKTIEFVAPNGFEWDLTGTPQARGFMGFNGADTGAITVVSSGSRTNQKDTFALKPLEAIIGGSRRDSAVMQLSLSSGDWTTNGANINAAKSPSTPGVITVSGLKIKRSDSISQTPTGDVRVRVNPAGGTSEYITVGVFAGRNVSMTVEDKTLPEIVSGVYKSDSTNGSTRVLDVTLTESSLNTWNERAEAIFTLNDEAKFRAVEIIGNDGFTTALTKGTMNLNIQSGAVTSLTGASLTDKKLTIVNGSGRGNTSATIKVKMRIWVTVKPGYTGDITFKTHEDNEAFGGELSGVVAKAINPFEFSATKTDIELGYMNIPLGDIIIKENVEGALDRISTTNRYLSTSAFSNANPDIPDYYTMEIGGYNWANDRGYFKSAGDYEVLSGDIVVDKYASNNGILELKIKRLSTTPSEIKLSGMTMDADRTLPEGRLELKLGGLVCANWETDGGGTTGASSDSQGCFDVKTWVPEDAKGYVNVITAAPNKDTKYTTEVEVTIGSNIIVANGKETEVDVAPFIQDGYTMVPVRAVAVALGITTEQINWNAASKTVTIIDTNRGRMAQFTAGSNLVKLNGMDVPFEGPSCLIKDNRTFLPFRALGEIVLGCPVDWDPDTRTAYFNHGGTTAGSAGATPAAAE